MNTRLDKLVEHEPGRRAVGVRHVPNTLDVFDTHFPRFPVLPGVLIIDDLTELARTVVAQDDDWVLGGVRRARFRHFVAPGDVLELSAELISRDDTRAVFRAGARVDGRPVTTVGQLVLERVDGAE